MCSRPEIERLPDHRKSCGVGDDPVWKVTPWLPRSFLLNSAHSLGDMPETRIPCFGDTQAVRIRTFEGA